jgi:hypothetical protein
VGLEPFVYHWLLVKEERKTFIILKQKVVELIMGSSYHGELIKWHQSGSADEVSFNVTGLFHS